MRVVVRSVSWVLAGAAILVVAAAWIRSAPDLDAEQAADVTVGALASVGHDIEVTEVRRETHVTENGKELDVWVVDAEVPVDGEVETLEVKVDADSGRLAYLDDRVGTDDAGHLLDDDEFAALSRYEDSPNDDWVLQNGLGSAGAVAIVLTCAALARSDTLWRRP